VTYSKYLTMPVDLPVAKYPGAEAPISFYDRLKASGTIPGVDSVAFSNTRRRGTH